MVHVARKEKLFAVLVISDFLAAKQCDQIGEF